MLTHLQGCEFCIYHKTSLRPELIDILSYIPGKVISLERTETSHTSFLYTGYVF